MRFVLVAAMNTADRLDAAAMARVRAIAARRHPWHDPFDECVALVEMGGPSPKAPRRPRGTVAQPSGLGDRREVAEEAVT